ncbi:hypothetical protein NKJ23_29100 [Mesorhizobium sp. M0184]|uniref:hypothetical protein n=1 Tax=Mesorhizobium sp. M0184 TaxID=2956906 RepID=UPI0033383C54
MAVNSAGAIARAPEKAYRQGFEDKRSGRPPQNQEPAAQDGPLDWALIPPRPRNAFWSIFLFTLGQGESPPEMGLSRGGHDRARNAGMAPCRARRLDGDKSVGEKMIIPLVRLGLIEPAPEPQCLALSKRGAETWWLFHARGADTPRI